ncbi:hypothetical protein P7K49_014851 [Saguinus oedipus]|uniref:FERM domain-containing protein n=1 Tax=Saguinus oedipus TaxID=9490 RepID=A0ABQ9VA99_SAGOE|nr:hypothetical protein P7K49_014851 [Saguinus oedipus]
MWQSEQEKLRMEKATIVASQMVSDSGHSSANWGGKDFCSCQPPGILWSGHVVKQQRSFLRSCKGKRPLSTLSCLTVDLGGNLTKPQITCEDRVIEHYKKLNGQTRGQAIVNYMSIVESLPTYGVHYYAVKDKQGIPWWLGLSYKGIFQYDYQDKVKPRKKAVVNWRKEKSSQRKQRGRGSSRMQRVLQMEEWGGEAFRREAGVPETTVTGVGDTAPFTLEHWVRREELERRPGLTGPGGLKALRRELYPL